MQDRNESSLAARIEESLAARFGERLRVDPSLTGLDELARIAGHRVHRDFLDRPVEPALLRLLCACALSAPSKSDLQQADILVLDDAQLRHSIISLMPEMPWLAQAPVLMVFLANGSIQINKVVSGLGHGLDESAMRSAQQIKFKPAKKDGAPVDYPARVHVEFRLAY